MDFFCSALAQAANTYLFSSFGKTGLCCCSNIGMSIILFLFFARGSFSRDMSITWRTRFTCLTETTVILAVSANTLNVESFHNLSLNLTVQISTFSLFLLFNSKTCFLSILFYRHVGQAWILSNNIYCKLQLTNHRYFHRWCVIRTCTHRNK